MTNDPPSRSSTLGRPGSHLRDPGEEGGCWRKRNVSRTALLRSWGQGCDESRGTTRTRVLPSVRIVEGEGIKGTGGSTEYDNREESLRPRPLKVDQ